MSSVTSEQLKYVRLIDKPQFFDTDVSDKEVAQAVFMLTTSFRLTVLGFNIFKNTIKLHEAPIPRSDHLPVILAKINKTLSSPWFLGWIGTRSNNVFACTQPEVSALVRISEGNLENIF